MYHIDAVVLDIPTHQCTYVGLDTYAVNTAAKWPAHPVHTRDYLRRDVIDGTGIFSTTKYDDRYSPKPKWMPVTSMVRLIRRLLHGPC